MHVDHVFEYQLFRFSLRCLPSITGPALLIKLLRQIYLLAVLIDVELLWASLHLKVVYDVAKVISVFLSPPHL